MLMQPQHDLWLEVARIHLLVHRDRLEETSLQCLRLLQSEILEGR